MQSKIIELPPPIGDERKKQMLKLLYWAAGGPPAESRELAGLIRNHGPAVLWRWSATYRHYRKMFRISGEICRVNNRDRDRYENEIWMAMRKWKNWIKSAELEIKEIGSDFCWRWQTTVWETEYRMRHVHERIEPLEIRLQAYKRERRADWPFPFTERIAKELAKPLP